MVNFTRFQAISTALIVVIGFIIAFPNFLPESVRRQTPDWLGWLPSRTINLGLDLQGGAYLLLEVDLPGVIRERMESVRDEVRTNLRKVRGLRYQRLNVQASGVRVHIPVSTDVAQAREILERITRPAQSVLLGMGTIEYELSEPTPGTFLIRLTDAYQRELRSQIVAQSIEVVRRRIDEMGTKEPTIQRQGSDRILVQVPGLQDPDALERVLQTTAKMSFQMVDEAAMADIGSGRVPPEDVLLYEEGPNGERVPYAIQRRIVVSGDRLDNATQDFSPQTGQPIVNFSFDSRGARQFGDATKNNVGRRFAIILDNKVISAPVIKSAILGGQGYIEGNFTVKSAQELAVLLNAGALPAALKVIEKRTVGAELGADSVEAGKYAAIYGLIAIAVFMVLVYGLFGGFASLALGVNIVLLGSILTLFQATLTLPGIAGIVLTMGMAIDGNVLIYERIREELRAGKSTIAAVDAGFRRASATIIDTNMTHLLAALVLFQLGVGPIRGFAVTLGVGVITSFFSCIMVTRLIIVTWLRMRRPKALTI
jgi:protein-export membrane protein SecD